MAAADRNGAPRLRRGRDVTAALGIDVGGTKIAAGRRRSVDRARPRATRRCRRAPSAAERRCSTTAPRSRPSSAAGGCRSGSGCASSSTSTAGRRARTRSTGATSTRRRRSTAPRVVVESDLRAAALAEARFGAGAGISPFLFVIVGTGASACLVVDGRPYAGARRRGARARRAAGRGVASGPALARAAGLERAEDVLADPAHAPLVDAAAAALGERARGARQRARPVAHRARRRSRRRAGVPGARRACAVRALLAYPRTPAAPGRRLRASAPDGGVSEQPSSRFRTDG